MPDAAQREVEPHGALRGVERAHQSFGVLHAGVGHHGPRTRAGPAQLLAAPRLDEPERAGAHQHAGREARGHRRSTGGHVGGRGLGRLGR